MLSTAILLISGILGIFWASKARNPFTKLCSLLVSFGLLVLVIPHELSRSYGPYFVAFASLMAGFEPGSSRRITNGQKFFFGISGVVFAAVAVDRIIIWPIALEFWPMVLIYFAVFAIMANKDQKRLRTRLGTLVAWLGLGVDHLLSLF